jgi:hypothetical protein
MNYEQQGLYCWISQQAVADRPIITVFRAILLLLVHSAASNIWGAPVRVDNATIAIELADRYTGFSQYRISLPPDSSDVGTKDSDLRRSEVASVVTITKDCTPFYHELIVGREVWEVHYDSLRFDTVLSNLYEGFAIIDPNTGHLLSIRLRFQNSDTNTNGPQTDVGQRESAIASFPSECHVPVDTVPTHSFAQALVSDLHCALCEVPEISAIYCIRVPPTYGKTPTSPTWVVWVDGIDWEHPSTQM